MDYDIESAIHTCNTISSWMSNEYSSAESNISQIRVEKERLEIVEKEIKSTMNSISQEVNSRAIEKDKLQSKADVLKAEISSLQKKLNSLPPPHTEERTDENGNTYSVEVDEFASEKRALNEEISALSSEASAVQGEITKIAGEISSLKGAQSKLTENKEKIIKSVSELSRQEQDLIEYQKNIRYKQEVIDNNRYQLTCVKDELTNITFAKTHETGIFESQYITTGNTAGTMFREESSYYFIKNISKIIDDIKSNINYFEKATAKIENRQDDVRVLVEQQIIAFEKILDRFIINGLNHAKESIFKINDIYNKYRKIKDSF